MQDIISQCWHADATERPAARELVQLLAAAAEAVGQMEAACKRGVVPLQSGTAAGKSGAASEGGGCCVIS